MHVKAIQQQVTNRYSPRVGKETLGRRKMIRCGIGNYTHLRDKRSQRTKWIMAFGTHLRFILTINPKIFWHLISVHLELQNPIFQLLTKIDNGIAAYALYTCLHANTYPRRTVCVFLSSWYDKKSRFLSKPR